MQAKVEIYYMTEVFEGLPQTSVKTEDSPGRTWVRSEIVPKMNGNHCRALSVWRHMAHKQTEVEPGSIIVDDTDLISDSCRSIVYTPDALRSGRGEDLPNGVPVMDNLWRDHSTGHIFRPIELVSYAQPRKVYIALDKETGLKRFITKEGYIYNSESSRFELLEECVLND